MDKAVDEDLFEVDIIQPARHLGPPDAGRLDRLQVVDLDAGNVLQG